jgi:hypothetical protein
LKVERFKEMTTAKRFEDLEVWQKAKELTNLIYSLSSAEFQVAFSLAELCSKQLASFIRYLESQPNARRLREEGVHYDV